MSLERFHLDDVTRGYMLAELERDKEKHGTPYISPRLSPEGARTYPQALREAISDGDDQTFEDALRTPGTFNPTETYARNGKTHQRKMNSQAPQTLAESEFNRYYIRGLCARICEEGGGAVEVFRARASAWARPESEALIGAHIDAGELLDDLRTHIGEEPSLLPDVNSGLSVRRVS